MGRRGEHRDGPSGGARWGGSAGGHGARIAAVRSDVGPIGPAVGVDPVLDPGAVASTCGGAVEVVPVVEGQVVSTNLRRIWDVHLRYQEVSRSPGRDRVAGHRADGDYTFCRCRGYRAVRQCLLITVDCAVEIGEGGCPPELGLMAEVGLIGDFIGVQLVVAVGVQARLHQIASELAVGTCGDREEFEQPVDRGSINHSVAEVVGPEYFVAVEILVKIVVPAPLYRGSVASAAA